jgi:SNF2 family DNA or RNA helicase
MHGDTLIHLQKMVLQRPLAKLADLVAWGPLVQERDRLLMQSEALQEHFKKRTEARRKDDQISAELRTMLTKDTRKRRMDQAKEELERMYERLKIISTELDAANAPASDHSDAAPNAAVNQLAPERLRLLKSSPVAAARVERSCSSKINFILEEVSVSPSPLDKRSLILLRLQVIRYSKEEKFLIFSASALSLLYVKEALDLHNIPCLDFTRQVKRKARQQNVTTFETSDHYRVFLMELKHGARGL